MGAAVRVMGLGAVNADLLWCAAWSGLPPEVWGLEDGLLGGGECACYAGLWPASLGVACCRGFGLTQDREKKRAEFSLSLTA